MMRAHANSGSRNDNNSNNEGLLDDTGGMVEESQDAYPLCPTYSQSILSK